MKIIKKVNTNAAIALDSTGQEIVVFGKGVGFPSVPYELTDMNKIYKIFYGVNSRYYGVIENVPEMIIIASGEIADMAKKELGACLNPNLPFTLADHLNFAIQRLRKGIDLTNAIAYDIRHFYPNETRLGEKALVILKERTNITLPSTEVVNIAMHLINAESKVDDMGSVIKTAKILKEVENIMTKTINLKIDHDSYEYSRFATHLRYLVQRLSREENKITKNEIMLTAIKSKYPKIYECAKSIASYLEGTWGWQCNDDEILYLMIHINRVTSK